MFDWWTVFPQSSTDSYDNSRPEPLLMEIACHFEDLANPVQFEPWRLLALIPLEQGREIEATIPATSLLTSVPFDNSGGTPRRSP